MVSYRRTYALTLPLTQSMCYHEFSSHKMIKAKRGNWIKFVCAAKNVCRFRAQFFDSYVYVSCQALQAWSENKFAKDERAQILAIFLFSAVKRYCTKQLIFWKRWKWNSANFITFKFLFCALRSTCQIGLSEKQLLTAF